MKLKLMRLVFMMALVCLAGCRTHQPVKFPTLQMLSKTHLFVITGAHPVKQDGSVFYYRSKCLSCGVDSEELTGTMIPKGTSTLMFDYTCPKCRNKQVVRIVITERFSGETSQAAGQATLPHKD